MVFLIKSFSDVFSGSESKEHFFCNLYKPAWRALLFMENQNVYLYSFKSGRSWKGGHIGDEDSRFPLSKLNSSSLI